MELYGTDDDDRGRASSAQHHHISELEESLENVRTLLTEANRYLGVTTRNYETAVKKRQEAESDAQRYSGKLRKQEPILEKQKEGIRALQDDVDHLRDKYDEVRNRFRDQEKELSTQLDTILDREGTIQDLRLHTDRLEADLIEAEEATSRAKEERERLHLRFNEFAVSSQATQRARMALERLRTEDLARAEEITKIRSEATTSVLTIENLR